MKVIGLIGSLRSRSYNRMVFQLYRNLCAEHFELIEGEYRNFPMYDQDIQNAGFPLDVRKLGQQIEKADGVIFFSPEYNYSVPGCLKNAIDWLSRLPDEPFKGKSAAVIGASPGRLGTGRMQYHLRQIAVFVDLYFMNKPEVMISNVTALFENGKLTDQATREILNTHARAFSNFIVSRNN